MNRQKPLSFVQAASVNPQVTGKVSKESPDRINRYRERKNLNFPNNNNPRFEEFVEHEEQVPRREKEGVEREWGGSSVRQSDQEEMMFMHFQNQPSDIGRQHRRSISYTLQPPNMH